MGFELSLEPHASYIVLDGWEIGLGAKLNLPLLVNDPTYHRKFPIKWGFDFDTRYYFDVKNFFYPYIAVFAGFDMINHYPESFLYNFGFGGGILVSLTQNLALDFALNLKAIFASTTFQRAEINPGILGIRYYF